MAFDAFLQFEVDGSAPPKVQGEDQAPPVQSPTAAKLDDEVLPEAQEKASDTTLPSKP